MARGDLLSSDEADARAEADAAERDRALAAFGLRMEQDDDAPQRPMTEFYLLPECVPVFHLWRSVQTQWRMGMAGPTGLDYAGVEAYMRMAHVPLRRNAETIELLRAMEVATLMVYAERRAETRQ